MIRTPRETRRLARTQGGALDASLGSSSQGLLATAAARQAPALFPALVAAAQPPRPLAQPRRGLLVLLRPARRRPRRVGRRCKRLWDPLWNLEVPQDEQWNLLWNIEVPQTAHRRAAWPVMEGASPNCAPSEVGQQSRDASRCDRQCDARATPASFASSSRGELARVQSSNPGIPEARPLFSALSSERRSSHPQKLDRSGNSSGDSSGDSLEESSGDSSRHRRAS